MFVGHFGMGLAGKKVAPETSLGTLILAAQWIDLVWPTFLLLGWEKVAIEPGISTVTPLDFIAYPWTHSAAMVLVWALLFGAVYWVRFRSLRTAFLLGCLVFSHWVLDLLVHIPDLELWPGSARYGFGLWNNLAVTLTLEAAFFAFGIWLYVRTMRVKGRPIGWGHYLFFALLAIIYLANVFGPPPPNVQAIAWAGQLQWLFVIWAYGLDRKRKIV